MEQSGLLCSSRIHNFKVIINSLFTDERLWELIINIVVWGCWLFTGPGGPLSLYLLASTLLSPRPACSSDVGMMISLCLFNWSVYVDQISCGETDWQHQYRHHHNTTARHQHQSLCKILSYRLPFLKLTLSVSICGIFPP